MAQWEILKMRAAYIDAERLIIQEAEKGNDLTGAETSYTIAFEPMSPEEFAKHEKDGKGNIKLSEEEYLLAKARQVREQLDQALYDEDYIKAKMLQTVLNGLERKYNRLRGRGGGYNF